MLKSSEKNKGITLIALIITIIVLLILSGVTINALFGDDSIIAKAREAADAYKNSERKEQRRFDNINRYVNGEEMLDDDEEPLVETNSGFFTYSNPDQNGNVFVTGLSSGTDGGEEAYNNNDASIINLVIPKQNPDGKNIKGIGWGAFENRSKITKLVLQDNIEELGSNAFKGCTGLTTLTIPITINSAATDYYAANQGFKQCTSISKIKLTKGKNGASAGYDYSDGNSAADYYLYTPWNLSETENLDIELENGITKIGKYMFYGCDNIRNITFPDSITQVGVWAFNGCTKMNLDGNKIKNITSLGEKAFYGCAGITGKIEINSAISRIPNYAFYGCSGFTELYIPKETEQIGVESFKGCTGLETLTIPITINAAATDAGATINAFGGCTGVSKVKLTKGKNGASAGFNYGTANWATDWYIFTPWCLSFKNYQNKGEGNINIIIEKGITSIGTNTFTEMTGTGTENYVTYNYTGTSTEWASVTGTEGITITNYNYSE